MTRSKTNIWDNEDELSIVNELLSMGLAYDTVAQYMDVLRYCRRWCEVHGYELAMLTAVQARELAETLPYTYSSRLRLRNALSNYWAISSRTTSPIKAIPSPRKPDMTCRALEEDQADALERAAKARKDNKGLAVLAGLYLGLRRFEIAQLRRDAFDDDFDWITFVGKGSKKATLPVHPVLGNALRNYNIVDEWLFPGRFGKHVHFATIWDWVRKVALDAQLGPVSTHVLRHTCLSTANDVTGDLRSVQAFARHSKPETTAGYTRVKKRKLVNVMHALDYAALAAEERAS